MKLAERILKAVKVDEALKQGDWKITDNAGELRGKNWTVAMYDEEEKSYIAIPELEADSEKDAVKNAKSYFKKHKISGKQQPTEVIKPRNPKTGKRESFKIAEKILDSVESIDESVHASQGFNFALTDELNVNISYNCNVGRRHMRDGSFIEEDDIEMQTKIKEVIQVDADAFMKAVGEKLKNMQEQL